MKKAQILTLIAEIETELSQIDRLKIHLIETHQIRKNEPTNRQIYFDESIALQLHNFYVGVENIFKRIAIAINGGVPRDPAWHRQLIDLMKTEVPKLRPAVISKSLHGELIEYLRFRHAIRNIYAFEIDSDRLLPLINKFENVSDQLRSELNSFINFLNVLANDL